jgi:hypothetical protein
VIPSLSEVTLDWGECSVFPFTHTPLLTTNSRITFQLSATPNTLSATFPPPSKHTPKVSSSTAATPT